MTSVLILFELTGNYGLILPLMLANMTAFLIARTKLSTPVYEALMEQDGILPKEPPPKAAATVSSLMLPPPPRVAADAPADSIEATFVQHQCLGVDLPDGRCGGLIIRMPPIPPPGTRASDLAEARTALRGNDPALPALALMARGDIALLPVVDDAGVLVGIFRSRNALARMNDDRIETVPI